MLRSRLCSLSASEAASNDAWLDVVSEEVSEEKLPAMRAEAPSVVNPNSCNTIGKLSRNTLEVFAQDAMVSAAFPAARLGNDSAVCSRMADLERNCVFRVAN